MKHGQTNASPEVTAQKQHLGYLKLSPVVQSRIEPAKSRVIEYKILKWFFVSFESVNPPGKCNAF